ncbi:MAG: hypothetical protein ACJ8G1_19025, partial [Vitreoscilla sp.]
ASKAAAAASVLRRLRELKDPIFRSAAWTVARDAIELDPRAWLATLGLEHVSKPGKPKKSMMAIFTSPGAGPKRERDTFKPKGFQPQQGGEAYAL